MYDYEFVTVNASLNALTGDGERPHHAEILRRAAEGWRLAQALVLNLPAMPEKVELIFERPKGVS